MITEPIGAVAPVSLSELYPRSGVAVQPAGVPDPAAVAAFQAALRAPGAGDGPEVIGSATVDPGQRLIETVGRIEQDINEWVAHVKALGTDPGEGVLNPQQIFAQMIRGGEMTVQLSLLTNLSKEMSEGVHTLFQQQN